MAPKSFIDTVIVLGLVGLAVWGPSGALDDHFDREKRGRGRHVHGSAFFFPLWR